MSTKSNIRSIRFSDEVKEIIEKVEGKNFQEKFENLIYKLDNEREQKQKDIRRLNSLIKEKEERLKKLNETVQRMDSLTFSMSKVKTEIENINSNISFLKKLSEKEWGRWILITWKSLTN